MSLIDGFSEEFVLMEKQRIPDGEGGFNTAWKEGGSFTGALTLDTSMQARIAEREGVTSVYTLTTKRAVNLDFHDIFKREDGSYFRVTSDGKDKHTPLSAGLDMRQVTAERLGALPQ